MASIKKFEDLEIWKISRELIINFNYLATTTRIINDKSLVDQMRRSVRSISANISEGFERNGNKEFIHFLLIAKASSGEFRAHLYIALDNDLIDKIEFDKLFDQCCRISAGIFKLIQYLKNSEMKGLRFVNPKQ